MNAHFRVYVARKHIDDIPVWSHEEDGNGNVLAFKKPSEAIDHARIVHKTTRKAVFISHFLNGERNPFWAISEDGRISHEGRRTHEYRPRVWCECRSKGVLYCKHLMIIDSHCLKKVEAA